MGPSIHSPSSEFPSPLMPASPDTPHLQHPAGPTGLRVGAALRATRWADILPSWNPLFSRWIKRGIYLPLRRGLSHRPALVLAHAVSGFVFHDLLLTVITGGAYWRALRFPFVTVWFTLLGLWLAWAGRRGPLSGATWARTVRLFAPLVASLAVTLVLHAVYRRLN